MLGRARICYNWLRIPKICQNQKIVRTCTALPPQAQQWDNKCKLVMGNGQHLYLVLVITGFKPITTFLTPPRLVYLLWSEGSRTPRLPSPRRSSCSDSVGLRSSLSSSQLSSCLNLKLDSLLKILCMFLLYCLDCPPVLSWTSLSDFRLTRESILLWNYES